MTSRSGLTSAKNARGNPLYGSQWTASYKLTAASADPRFLRTGRYRPVRLARLEASSARIALNSSDVNTSFRGIAERGRDPWADGLDVARRATNNVAENAQLQRDGQPAILVQQLFSTATRVAWIQENLERNRGFGCERRTGFNGQRAYRTLRPRATRTTPGQHGQRSGHRTINYLGSQTSTSRTATLWTLMYRRDGSSLFGAGDRWQNFYRVAGAWRVRRKTSAIPGMQELKLRAARGTAGLRPAFARPVRDVLARTTAASRQGPVRQPGSPSRPIQTERRVRDQRSVRWSRFDLEVVVAQRDDRGSLPCSVRSRWRMSGGLPEPGPERRHGGMQDADWEVIAETCVSSIPPGLELHFNDHRRPHEPANHLRMDARRSAVTLVTTPRVRTSSTTRTANSSASSMAPSGRGTWTSCWTPARCR